jgi:hypothetical protein
VNPDFVIEFEGMRRNWLKEHPGRKLTSKVAGQLVRQSSFVRSFETVLVQSGHRVLGARLKTESSRMPLHFGDGSLSGRKAKSPYDSRTLFSNVKGSFPQLDQFGARRARWTRKLARYGIAQTDPLLYAYSVVLALENARN